MQAVKHPAHDKYIGAPQNWDESKGACGALSVAMIENDPYVPTMESAWTMDLADALAMVMGLCHIRLGVVGAVTHPPVYMQVQAAGDPLPREEVVKRFELAHMQLLGLAQTYGINLNTRTDHEQ